MRTCRSSGANPQLGSREKAVPSLSYNLLMQSPIKIRGKFATASDTAKILGVSPARTRRLIAAARLLAESVTDRARFARSRKIASGPSTKIGKSNAQASNGSRSVKAHR